MPPKHPSFEKHDPNILTLTFADDLDLGSRRCAFIPNMSLVTKLVRSNGKMLSFHVKFVQTDKWTGRWTTVKQNTPKLSIRGH